MKVGHYDLEDNGDRRGYELGALMELDKPVLEAVFLTTAPNLEDFCTDRRP